MARRFLGRRIYVGVRREIYRFIRRSDNTRGPAGGPRAEAGRGRLVRPRLEFIGNETVRFFVQLRRVLETSLDGEKEWERRVGNSATIFGPSSLKRAGHLSLITTGLRVPRVFSPFRPGIYRDRAARVRSLSPLHTLERIAKHASTTRFRDTCVSIGFPGALPILPGSSRVLVPIR